MTEPGRLSIGIELNLFASTKVKKVIEHGSAASAGIIAGDTILRIGDLDLTGAQHPAVIKDVGVGRKGLIDRGNKNRLNMNSYSTGIYFYLTYEAIPGNQSS